MLSEHFDLDDKLIYDKFCFAPKVKDFSIANTDISFYKRMYFVNSRKRVLF